MKENNDIDQLFKNGLQKEYPVDNALWASVESQLTNQPKGNLWFFNLNTIAIIMILFICAIIPTDSVRTSTINDKPLAISKKVIDKNEIQSTSPSAKKSNKVNQNKQIASSKYKQEETKRIDKNPQNSFYLIKT